MSKKIVGQLGTLSGGLGLLVCLLAIAGRLYGHPTVQGHDASKVFLAGVGLLALACWLKLECRSGGSGTP